MSVQTVLPSSKWGEAGQVGVYCLVLSLQACRSCVMALSRVCGLALLSQACRSCVLALSLGYGLALSSQACRSCVMALLYFHSSIQMFTLKCTMLCHWVLHSASCLENMYNKVFEQMCSSFFHLPCWFLGNQSRSIYRSNHDLWVTSQQFNHSKLVLTLVEHLVTKVCTQSQPQTIVQTDPQKANT